MRRGHVKLDARSFRYYRIAGNAGAPTMPNLNLRLDDALMKRIDKWRGRQDVPPTRPEAIRQILDKHLDAEPPPPAKRTTRKRT